MLFLEVGKIEGFWRELLLALCKPVYKLIVYLYELFEVVATAEIITNEALSKIYTRVGLLLGMYMMFRIIFSFIQMLINPDYITDKEKGIGNIAKKAILVVVLLGVTPFIFNKAIELQNFIVGVETKDNVIAKLIFPDEIIGSEKFGAVLSASLFDSFYRYDEEYNGSGTGCPIKPYSGDGESKVLFSHILNTNGNINAAKTCLDHTWNPSNDTGETRYQIAFTQNGLFALVVGLVVCYVLLNYTLMIGARVVQLAFLRLISPMAILGYLSPKKDGMFEKWLKMCTTTYIDLFVRMAIIFFIVFMVDAIIGSDTGIALNRPYDHMWIVNIVMILALLLFGKKAPELLKELFPSSGGAASLGFGLKSPKKMFDSMLGGNLLNKGYDKVTGFAKSIPKRAYGAAAVGLRTAGVRFRDRTGELWEDRKDKDKLIKNLGRLVTSTAGGFFGGTLRGTTSLDRNSRNNMVQKGRDIGKERIKRRDAGYKLPDELLDTFRGYFNIKTEAERRSAALDMAIYASQQNRSRLVEGLNSDIESITTTSSGRAITQQEKQFLYELSSFTKIKDKKGNYIYMGTLDGEVRSFDETDFVREVDKYAPIGHRLGNKFKQHVETMTALSMSETKAGKQKAALEKQAQKKEN